LWTAERGRAFIGREPANRMESLMAAYLLAQLTVHDPESFGRYREAVAPLVDRFGGRYRVRGGAIDVLEGDLGAERLVVIEFQSRDAARLFYDSPEYQQILPLRQRAADGSVVIVEGV
jgi:uncharacterized protein (DUF1330 family)